MTDDSEPSAPADATQGQQSAAAELLDPWRRRFPGQKDSVLFCMHKLQQNPDLGLRDFREEAALYGISLAGRSLHSARVLLGLQVEGAPEDSPAVDAESAPGRTRRRRHQARLDAGADTGDSIERQVLNAMLQIQSSAGEQADRLRLAIRQAIVLLQRALDDR